MEVSKSNIDILSLQCLPDELILSIFIHLRKHYDWTDGVIFKSILAVSQVCSRWRTVALAASVLWSELVFRAAEAPNLQIATRAYARMEACLLRSRTHQLNIHFDLTGSNDAIVPLETFKKFVEPNLWRCCILEVVIPDQKVALDIFPLPYNLSSVQSFGVAIEHGLDDHDPSFDESVEVGGLPGAPFSPSRFRINANIPAHTPYLNTSNLEALYVASHNIGYSTILQLLRRAKNVQRMHLGFYYPRTLFQKVLSLPSLSFLSTRYDWPHRNLRATALHKISITEPLFLKQSEMWSNLSALFPQLRHLTIAEVLAHFTFREVDEIFSLLSCIPQLITLELKGWTAKWLDYFTTDSPLAPPALDTESLGSPGPSDAPTTPGDAATKAPEFLPNLRLFIISRADEEASELFSEQDLQLALWRVLRARTHLLLHYDGLFMTAATGDVEEGEALLRESMDLGHVQFGNRRVDGYIYSGLGNDIVV
ncbi:hypothetical protein DL93DRAFT_1778995 [Clavulina sp. PMI_390]|nr:hypothetical protein DL93DRAFT_1778995 [Clavulina sp. PMI_390]